MGLSYFKIIMTWDETLAVLQAITVHRTSVLFRINITIRNSENFFDSILDSKSSLRSFALPALNVRHQSRQPAPAPAPAQHARQPIHPTLAILMSHLIYQKKPSLSRGQGGYICLSPVR